MEKDIFFNNEIKHSFLSNYPEESQNTYAYVFRKSAEMEDLIEKDLFNFSVKQTERFLKSLELSTLNAIKTYGRVVSSYFNWAIENGYRKDENFLKNIGSDWFNQFINEEKSLYTIQEIREIENQLVNYQDKIVLRLIFEGVYGRMASELVNLTINDVEGNILHLVNDDGSKRDVEVSDESITFIKKAYNEEEYFNKNGESTGKRSVSKLIKNDYIIRTTESKGTINTTKASNFLIYRRLTIIEEFMGIKSLKPKMVMWSGAFHMGKELYLRDGELGDNQYEQIFRKYDMKDSKYLREYCNIETIRNLYKDI